MDNKRNTKSRLAQSGCCTYWKYPATKIKHLLVDENAIGSTAYVQDKCDNIQVIFYNWGKVCTSGTTTEGECRLELDSRIPNRVY